MLNSQAFARIEIELCQDGRNLAGKVNNNRKISMAKVLVMWYKPKRIDDYLLL